MRRFSKERLAQMDKYKDIRDDLFSKSEQEENDREVEMELLALKSMQESLSKELISFMATEKIGVVKLTEILQTSSRQTSRIMNAEANVTLATLASIAQVMKKRPRIVFE